MDVAYIKKVTCLIIVIIFKCVIFTHGDLSNAAIFIKRIESFDEELHNYCLTSDQPPKNSLCANFLSFLTDSVRRYWNFNARY